MTIDVEHMRHIRHLHVVCAHRMELEKQLHTHVRHQQRLDTGQEHKITTLSPTFFLTIKQSIKQSIKVQTRPRATPLALEVDQEKQEERPSHGPSFYESFLLPSVVTEPVTRSPRPRSIPEEKHWTFRSNIQAPRWSLVLPCPLCPRALPPGGQNSPTYPTISCNAASFHKPRTTSCKRVAYTSPFRILAHHLCPMAANMGRLPPARPESTSIASLLARSPCAGMAQR